MTGAKVLVVDDDPTIIDVLRRYLQREGYAVATAADGPSALDLARRTPPDLVVLDVMLPGIDGLEVARRLRADNATAVIMLTALGETEDRIAGLEVGADDYVVKPFSPRELVLRISAVLRRGTPGPDPDAAVRVDGDLVVDEAARRVTLAGRELALTAREHDLLVYFMRRPGTAMTREDLLRDVWGWDFGDTSTVTVHVKRIRAKLSGDPGGHQWITTVWGVGYRFDSAAPRLTTAGS